MKISDADLALTDSEDSKRSISVTTVLLKIHIFITTITTNAKKKIYINVDSHSMAFKAALQGGALRPREREVEEREIWGLKAGLVLYMIK